MLKVLVNGLVGLIIGGLATAAAMKTAQNLDPVKLAPEMYKVAFENDKFRVIDYRLPAGGKEPMHSHPHGVLVYLFTDATMKTTLASGAVTQSSGKAGNILWRDPVTHQGENIGKDEIHELVIEPKKAFEK
jgi:quercetin dioxygenase-like cupin family protein